MNHIKKKKSRKVGGNCVTLLTWDMSHQMHGDRKNGSCQRAWGTRELLFSGSRVSVLQHEKNSGEWLWWWLHNAIVFILLNLILKMKSLSCVRLFAIPWTAACKAPLYMGFFGQELWSGLPFPSPGDLPDPGIKPRSPALQADSLPSELPGKPWT